MKMIFRLAQPIALMLACIATAHAEQRHETRPVSGYHSVALSAPILVEIVQGDTEGVVLDGEDSALSDLETVVEDGSLKIRNKSNSSWANFSKVVAHVSVRSVDALSTKGSGDIRAEALKCGDLKLSIAGSGDIRIAALSASDLHVSIAGSGDALIAGKVNNVSTSIAGSGDMKAGKLESRESKVSIAGSGDAMLWAHDTISVSIMGSGDVRYYGDPAVTKSVIGSGTVKRVSASPS
ncbi:MAG TPA: head GIN domain-containing protein [Usitatibacter sp.]